MWWQVLFLLFVVLTLAVETSQAQRYKFKEYRQEHGLGNLAVTALLQDGDGYIWVGTQNGLFRHDGLDFVRYGVHEGLPGSFVLSLAKAPDGSIWVNTHLGLARRKDGRFVIEHTYQQSADSAGMGMAINSRGDAFISTPNGVMIGSKSGEKSNYQFKLAYRRPEQRDKTVFQIALDASGRAWFGCGEGLCILDAKGSLEFRGREAGVPVGRWDGILRDSQNSWWLRSNERLLVMRGGSSKFENTEQSVEAQDMSYVYSGPGGRLYFPSNGGLWILETTTKSWRKVSAENGLSGEVVSALLSDQEGNVWIGFLGDGLARWLGPDNWEGWTTNEGLNSNTVWATLRDGRRTVWAATDVGINYQLSGQKNWQSLGGIAGRSIGRVMSIAIESPRVMWAASQSKGLVRVDTDAKTFRILGFPNGSPIQNLFGLMIDRDARLWLGSSSGLFQASFENPLHWRAPVVPQINQPETIYTITQDTHGRIWAAGNSGLLIGEGDRWVRIQKSNGLMTNSTWFAREIAPDEMFVGYLESVGDTRIQTSGADWKFRHEANEPGAPAYMNYFIGRDSKGLLWKGTDQGVVVSDDKAKLHLTEQDGLIWNDCNSNSFFADYDGSVWIGTTRGLSHGRLPNPLQLPMARLGAVQLNVNGKPVLPEGLIKVGKPPNELSLVVSPLTFQHSERVEYQFRLGEPSGPWLTTRRRTVEFSGLQAGSSRLQARMRISDGDWSPILIDLPVEVEAPFWQSWVGRLVRVLLSLGIVAALWRYRHKKLIVEKRRLESAVSTRTSEIERLLEEAREASRLKTEFLANMSHEIRTPMNGVLGMLQITAATNLDPEQRSYVQLAKDSAERLLSLLNEILDLSKVESGIVEIESSPFHLKEAVRDIGSILEPSAIEKGIRLETEFDENVAEWVSGDKHRLQQVLLNLLGNAIKFTDQGSVSLSVSSAGADRVDFKVNDTGIGIASSKLAVIFDAFRQADGSMTRRFGGTGLGLSISRKLVELMGGEIRVESELGLGSSFHFSIVLPVAEAVELSDSQGSAAQRVRPLKILLAEDNRVNQLVAIKMLERDGHTVQLAQDGAIAVEAIQREEFDVILMDIQMPVLDGIHATQQIRSMEAGKLRRTPIIALSAGVLQEERIRCLSSGMDEFLSKPISQEQLRDALGRLTAHPPKALSPN